MKKYLKYKLLTLLTAILLLGIVAMQIYWLTQSFNQEKQRVDDIVNEQLTQTINYVHTKHLLKYTSEDLAEIFLDQESLFMDSTDIYEESGKDENSDLIKVQLGDSLSNEEQIEVVKQKFNDLTNSLVNFQKDSTLNEPLTTQGFEDYAYLINKRFLKKGLKTDFQLSLLDSNSQIIQCSTDTNLFNSLDYKSNRTEDHIVNFQKERLVVGIGNINLLILKRISTLLFISSILILLGIVSFTILIVLLFRQKRHAEIREDFIKNMTHELNTPISSVSVALELLLDPSYNQDKQKRDDMLRIAQNEIKRLSKLIENTMKVAVERHQPLPLQKESIQIGAILNDVCENIQPLLIKNNAQVHLINDIGMIELEADKMHLTNVIHNLIENAIKYKKPHQPCSIQISVTQDKQSTKLSLCDNGIGISPKHVDKIFDKFYRVPQGDVHNSKGYGLGLSYVKEVVERHKGKIKVNSELGIGSKFVIELPN